MQCAARSAPQLASAPRSRATISFVPTESVEAASRRRSSMGWRPAKAPKPAAPVDSTAARRRSTRAVAVSSETPAEAYVFVPSRTAASLNEQFRVELRTPDRPARDEADGRVAHREIRPPVRDVEQVGEGLRLTVRIVGLEVQLAEREDVGVHEQLLEPLPGRVQLDPVTGAGRDERPP